MSVLLTAFSNTPCPLAQNGSVNVDSVVTVAARLAEAGHYGAERIALVSSRLQDDWKSLTTTLEERSNMLAMATGFHQGAEQVPLRSDVFMAGWSNKTINEPGNGKKVFAKLLKVSLCVQFLLRVEGWVKLCSEGSLPTATAELEAATKKHQELNEEISANYTQVFDWKSSRMYQCNGMNTSETTDGFR